MTEINITQIEKLITNTHVREKINFRFINYLQENIIKQETIKHFAMKVNFRERHIDSITHTYCNLSATYMYIHI